jgi:hypothetical protein
MMAARLVAAAALAVLAVLCWAAGTTTALGMNWGTQATHPLPPKAVVQVLQDNGIKKVKLFDTDPAAMSALAGTGIEVMVAIPNNMLADLADDAGKAKDWVKRNVRRYDFDGGVTIKSVSRSLLFFLSSLYIPHPPPPPPPRAMAVVSLSALVVLASTVSFTVTSCNSDVFRIALLVGAKL